MAKTQLQLSFLAHHRQDDPVSVWSTLDNERRAQTITALARVIAKLAAASHATSTADANEKEVDDER